jgi:hypothetical protein
MLLLDSALQAGPLTLFRDHLSPETFHYLPANPAIVVENGAPRAQLVKYRGDRGGGGVLGIEFELRWPPDALSKTRDMLSTQFGAQQNLVPVLFDGGSVRLSVLNFAQQANLFVEGVLGTAEPSLLGALRASFATQLTEEGTSLIDAALRSGAAPVLVVYDLQYSGLAPARALRATVRYKMAYDYLRSRLTGNSLYFKADLDREAEKLTQNGAITIADVDFVGLDAAALATRAEEVRKTLSDLMQGLFFRPAPEPATLVASGISPGSAAEARWAADGRPQLAFLLRDFDQNEQDTITYDLSATHLEMRRIGPQAVLRLPAGADHSNIILSSTLDWPPPVTNVRAFTPPDADWSGVAAIQVDLRQNSEVTTLVLTAADRDKSANVAGSGIEYSVAVHSAPEPDALGDPAPAESVFRPLPGPNLFLDPAVLSGRRLVRILLGVVDASIVSRVSGVLSMDDQSRQFQLTASQPEADIAVRGTAPLTLHAEFALPEGRRLAIDRTLGPIDRMVVLNQPAGEFVVVTLMLLDPLHRYASVSVMLEAAEGAPRRNFTLDSASAVAQWSAPRAAAGPSSFRYQVKKVLRNASVIDSDWLSGSGSLLVVGDLDVRMEAIQGVILGADTSLGGLIQLAPSRPPEGVDAALDIVLDPGQTAFTANLAFAKDAPREYSVSGQIFGAAATMDITAVKETSEVILITPPKTTASTPAH